MNENIFEVPKAVIVGQIFRYSWGYDQTNVDYFQVVSLSPSGKTAKLRPIGQRQVPGTNLGGMSCKVEPIADSFEGSRVLTCRVKHYRGEPMFGMPHGIATLVAPGQSAFCSWYA